MKGDPHSVALEVVYSPRCSLVAGVDEVGRGALFGPLVAAAVALTEPGSQALTALGVTDSKRLTPQRREQLVEPIQAIAITWALGVATVHDIERVNVLQATFLAMDRASVACLRLPSCV